MMVRKQAKKAEEAAVKYTEGVGRRKTAIARVRIGKGAGRFFVNEKEVRAYFPLERLSMKATAPLTRLHLGEKISVSARVKGGGPSAQAGAVRHGLARALLGMDAALKAPLRAHGFLTRDPRMVERKKYGLKKARRAPQWQKR